MENKLIGLITALKVEYNELVEREIEYGAEASNRKFLGDYLSLIMNPNKKRN